MAKLSISRRRNRRLALATAVLAIVALFLFAVVWREWEQICVARWVTAVNELEIEVHSTVDRQSVSSIGRLRSWLKMPIVSVFLWNESEASGLLKAPNPGPSYLVLQLGYGMSPELRSRLEKRFPKAEFRTIGGRGGMGGPRGF